jgi:hypothetical protein
MYAQNSKKQQISMWIDCLGAWPFGLAGFEVLPFSDIYLGFSGLASN